MSAKMPKIFCAGIAVLDEVFRIRQLPAPDTKTDASEFITTGGGCAPNAAVAIARLGGRAGFAGPLGQDDTAERVLAHLRMRASTPLVASNCRAGVRRFPQS